MDFFHVGRPRSKEEVNTFWERFVSYSGYKKKQKKKPNKKTKKKKPLNFKKNSL